MDSPRRRVSREVRAGRLVIGGRLPVSIQSMTNTDPMDTAATAEQILSLAEAGAQMVRLTVPSVRAANNLARIRHYLESRGADIPLVADVHFNPAVALAASQNVHKVRINPGNFALSKTRDGSPETALPARVEDAFIELVEHLRTQGVALRIGVNHGSLSPRILALYGNTVQAMLVSALEFVEIAERAGYFDIVISMKSSIPQVMIRANRELVREMDGAGRNYPIHLGVTEAGEGLAGRLKSAAGIGPLLLDGIGDTVRVSLSEPPCDEIPVCRTLLSRLALLPGTGRPAPLQEMLSSNPPPFPPPAIPGLESRRFPLVGLCTEQDERFDVDHSDERRADFIIRRNAVSIEPPFSPFELARRSPETDRARTSFIELEPRNLAISPAPRFFEAPLEAFDASALDRLPPGPAVLILPLEEGQSREQLCRIMPLLKKNRPQDALIALYRASRDSKTWPLWAAMDLGEFLMHRAFAGIILSHPDAAAHRLIEISFELLQATRQRLTRAEFITCPTCGRTRFDLPGTLRRVEDATRHLKGLKIAVMGCMVNGPGEMADAEFG
jgi:(E)-4-hydroxy-3-methylbut-2-enyl-diphosphate synthase